MKYIMSDEQKLTEYFKVVKMRLEGATNTEILENTNFPTWRVLEFFMTRNKLTLPIDRAAFNKAADVTFFNCINTVDKAYILGFLYADGCIYDKGRLGFCISESDIQILEFIKFKMQSISPITIVHNTKGAKNRQPQALLRISSVKLIDTLRESFGVQQNKTLREGLKFPDLTEDLLLAFIRGLSDGDGNLYFVRGGYNTILNSVFRWTFCMTDKPFILQLKEYLLKRGVIVRFYEKQGKTCKYYLLSTSSRNHAKMLCDLLYSNNDFCLQRKKDKYLKYLKLLDNTVLNSEINKSESV